MDKQKKQILILVVVVLLGGGALGFLYRDKIFGKPPAPVDNPPVAEQPAPGQPVPGQPAPTPGQPVAVPGQPAAGTDLPKPDLKVPSVVSFTVDNYKSMRDPLKVLDPDAAFPTGQAEVAALKLKWVLRGIAIIGKETVKTYKKNPDGTENPVPELVERDILACFFSDSLRFYREGDRLEGFHFSVKTIHFSQDGAWVEVEGDLGMRVKLNMNTNERYGK